MRHWHKAKAVSKRQLPTPKRFAPRFYSPKFVLEKAKGAYLDMGQRQGAVAEKS